MSSVSGGKRSKARAAIDFDGEHIVLQSDLVLSPPVSSALTTGASAESSVVCTLPCKLLVSMKGTRVLRFAEGRRHVSSLTLRVSQNALKNLMEVDDTLLSQARKQGDDWFGASRVNNVDEFFRASTATDRSSGIVAKLSLDGSRSSRAPPFSAKEGDDVDVLLQIVGMRFLRQHVDVLWRFVSATPSKGPFAGQTRSLQATDEEDEDTLVIGPTPEERQEMFNDLFRRIEAERCLVDARLRELDSLADGLEDGHDSGDACILEIAANRLDVMMAAVPSCTQDTSCCS